MGFNKDLLFEDSEETDTVIIPGKGEVTVRVLTRAQIMKIRKSVKSIPDAIARQDVMEQKFLVAGMVDPEVDMQDCALWQQKSKAGEIDLVLNKINEISGLEEGYGKDATLDFIEDPEAEFRVLPSD